MSEVVFDHPRWLLLLWLLVPLALLHWHARRRTNAAALDFALAPMAERLLPPRAPARPFWRGAAASVAFACFAVAAAGPRFGVFFEPVKERGADLVVLLDVSRSMLSEDVAPNRLERARSDVKDLIARVVGHRLALIAFAGKAVVACPLTTDRAFFKSVLDQVGPGSAPRGGTAIGDALRVGLEALPAQHDRDQALLLITDGEDQDSYPLEAAAIAAERGVKIFTVGLGDPTEGARVPVNGEDGARTFLKHDGQEVWSKMQESLLTDLATKTGGAYVPARTRNYDLGEVYEKHLADLAAGDIREEKRKRLFPQFQLFLALGFACTLIELLIAPPRRRRAVAVTAALLLCAMLPPPARAATPGGDAPHEVRAGIAALNQGKADDALARFEAAAAAAPADARILFDRALAKEAKRDFDGARADYLSAAAAPDGVLAVKSQFNLGTLAIQRAQLALGEKPEDAAEDKRKEALERIDEAIRHFRACLDADPKHEAARHHLESLRVWQKAMRELWAKRDREKQREAMNALQFLEWLFEQEGGVRDAARALAQQPDTPIRRAAVQELAQRQRDLKQEVPPLQKKLADLVQQMAGGANGGAGGAAGQPPPNAPDQKQLQQMVESLVQAAEQSGAAMAKAASAIDAGRLDEGDADGKAAQQPLDQLWLALSNCEATLARGLKLAKDVVAKSEPFVPSADATAAAAAPRIAESDERLAQAADVLAPKAQHQLEELAKAPPPPPPPPAPDPSHPNAPPPVDPEAMKKALEKAVEVGPQVADLARAAAQSLAAPDFVKALEQEKQALALLEALDQLWPKPPKDDQQKQDPQDQKQQDQKQPPKPDDSQKKQDDQKQDDSKQQPKPDQKKPEMTPQQAQALLRRAAERSKQKQQAKKEAEESVLVPVRVDRDW